MELNLSFLTGLGCGLCLGLSYMVFKRYISCPGATQNIRKAQSKKYASNEEFKVVLVVRTDLNMSKGKIAAQCGHAAVGVYEKAMKNYPDALKIWLKNGQAKIALKTDSLEEMENIAASAKRLGLTTSMIRDAGRTQIAPNTITVLGVGPGPKELIDKVTGHLKLL